MTANPPAEPLRWVLLGLTAALLVVGIVGAATVDSDSGGNSKKASSVSGNAQPPNTSPPTTSTAGAPAAPVTTAPAAVPPATEPATPAGSFWAVLLTSFPDTPAGNERVNVALSVVRGIDGGATIIKTEAYQSLRPGLVAVISSAQPNRAAAVALAERFRRAGYGDANARCLSTGPPCP